MVGVPLGVELHLGVDVGHVVGLVGGGPAAGGLEQPELVVLPAGGADKEPGWVDSWLFIISKVSQRGKFALQPVYYFLYEVSC